MPSSISNSKPTGQENMVVALRVPETPRLKPVILLLAVAVSLFGGWELFLASDGETPPVLLDDRHSWMKTWTKIGGDERQVVFVGSSRVMLSINPADVAETYECKPTQVINMGTLFSSGEPMLRDLADQDKFDGWLVVEVIPTHFFGREPSIVVESNLEQTTRPDIYIDAELKAHELWRRYARVSLASNSPLYRLQAKLAGDTGESNLVHIGHADRWLEARADKISPSQRDALAVAESDHFKLPGKKLDADELKLFLRLLQKHVDALSENGVEVVFLRMPSDRDVWQVETSRFPRKEYWDALAEKFPGRTIHFQDDSVLKKLQTFDGSHLESANARTASRRLGKLLRDIQNGQTR